ncbi:hypothetical protein LY28_02589 [Ruminiclostridium sufflavum DSM 19573]|uniref:Uncharacterized protein n=1 Tax=Ruminiclostridium sufflavum DSM 19573 TaxID=1121337 RepID=A0A318XVY7_9FIRM|nr:DUF5685 family protein [Ruminiclostridium sufflavum]PYG86967.1 hypothetical protein LY28_02589 [Ruminiclostridium sufflavum DSM 19573]
MFGYIIPEKPELKMKEFDMYRAYYCGVCKSIGKRHGQIKRMTLTYDAAFLALLLCSVLKVETKMRKERCMIHPTKKSFIIFNEIIDYSSDINIILAYNNIVDKWKDDKSKTALAGLVGLKRAYKRLTVKYSEKCAIISKRLEELSLLEKDNCDSIDAAAEPFARLMEEVLDYKKLDDNTRRVLRWMGYNLGKWIYLIDAFDDLEDDIKNSSYNPFVTHFKYDGSDVSEFRSKIKEQAEFTLLYCLGETSKAFELLETKENKGILENILYIGMLSKTDKILCQRSCVKGEKSI